MHLVTLNFGRTIVNTEFYSFSAGPIYLQILDIKGSADENLRRHIISLAYAMKWRKLLDGVYKIDMDRVNAWCIESGFGKKPLYEYTHIELPELVSQFKKVYEHHIVNI